MNREEYARRWSTGHAMNGQPVRVPENIERRHVHEPCWMCGTALGVCKHRIAA